MQKDTDFKNMIGRLFFDRAKSVPESKQLSEELVNSMYGTHFCQDAYRVVVLCAANLEDPDLLVLNERMHHCARQLVERLSRECHDLLYHFDHLRIHLLLNYEAEQDKQILFLLRSQLQAVPPMHNGSYPAVVCCSRRYAHIQNIRTMLEEASNIMWTRFSSAEPILVHPNELPTVSADIQNIFTSAEQQMKAACSILDPVAFRESLDAFFALPDELVTRFETRVMIRNVEYYMFDVNRDLIAAFTDVAQARERMVQHLRSATSLSEYKRRYRDHLLGLMQQIIDHSSAHLSRPIRIAQRYIQDHFHESLRLEQVAHHVGLTAVYLSARFKQETGIGFSDYLNKCRIAQAKKLLETTQEPVISIARQVGYAGPRYFSRVFKQIEGIRPAQYRTLLHNQRQPPT